MPKNLTLSIDEDLLNRARVLAAMRRTSVNEMVRGFLAKEVEAEGGQARRADIWAGHFSAADATANVRQPRQSGTDLFNREDFYEEVMHERRLL